ncbi:hypothetical protein C8R44DRAFT_882431 [Mycena epipterygia]|nr:hypothetical protein C8R44DRAFT_882431 [Mycena epipterygia]
MSSEPIHAPALELPYELTAKIFVYCLQFTNVGRPTLATLELWSSLLLEFQSNAYAGVPTMFNSEAPLPDNTCDLFNLWLARAASYPLSITVICRDGLAGMSKNVF